MERAPYHLPFTSSQVPAWLCPMCQSGHLTLKKESLLNKETAASRQARKHEDWEPNWIQSVFACIFVCGNPQCKEPVACSGRASVDYFEYEDDEYGWAQSAEEAYTPHHFSPSLILMDIPKHCPEAVTSQLHDSFALFFSDPGAALNCCRAAVEALMTDLGVKRFTTSKKPGAAIGKRKSLNLHQRIEMLPAKYTDQKELLIAVKWLGNAGSHSGTPPSAGDVRTAYDMLELVLSEIYEQKGKKLKAVAKKVNKKKGI